MADEGDRKKMTETLESQLHEQYAQNNNSYFNSIVVLLCTMFAVIGSYGYIFIRTEIEFSKDFGQMTTVCDGFTLDALMLTAIASLFVLAVCYCICVYQGAAQRNEQFIIDAIRRKYYGSKLDGIPKVFPNSYHPYYKQGCDFIQGHYGNFIKYLSVLGMSIILATAVKVCLFFIISSRENYSNHIAWGMTIASGVIILLIGGYCFCFYCERQRKYYQRHCEYYLTLKPDLPEDEQTFTKLYCEACNEICKAGVMRK